MSKLKTELPTSEIEKLGIFQAATGDGYWEDAATNDIQLVYMLGQLKATRSLHQSQGGGNHTRLRIKWLEKQIKDARKRQPS